MAGGRLFYQPIGLPSIGSAASSTAAAASAIGGGFGDIGSGLTRLGERRQKRLEEANERETARQLEQIALLTENAGDEESLNLLAESLVGLNAPEGASKLIGNRREDLLANVQTRQAGRKDQIANDQALFELEGDQLTRAFQTEFGADINEVRRLASIGDLEGSQALEADILKRAGNRFGTNPQGILQGTLELFGVGDDTRTKEAANLLGLEEDRITNQGLRQDQAIKAAEEADRNRDADYAYGRTVRADQIQDAKDLRTEQTEIAISNIFNSSFSKDDALRRIQDSDLDPRVRQALADKVEAAFKEDPDLLDKYNPLDPSQTYDRIFNDNDRLAGLAESVGLEGVQTNSNSNLDPVATTASITSNVQTLMQTDGALGIATDAAQILADTGGKSIPDLGGFLIERYPQLGAEDSVQDQKTWRKRLERTKRRHRLLTDQDMVAIVDRAFQARGLNYGAVNLLPGGEGADEFILDVDLVDSIAAEYEEAKANGSGNLAAQGAQLSSFVTRSRELEAEIPRLIEERNRTFNSDRADAKEERTRLEKRITQAQDELAGIETSVSDMLPDATGQAPTTVDSLAALRNAPMLIGLNAAVRLRNGRSQE